MIDCIVNYILLQLDILYKTNSFKLLIYIHIVSQFVIQPLNVFFKISRGINEECKRRLFSSIPSHGW